MSYQQCLKQRNLHIKSDGEIRKGSFGKVYILCEASLCKKVIKIVRLKSPEEEYEFREEARILRAARGVAPKLYESFECAGYGFLVMERFSGDMAEKARKRAQKKRRAVEVYSESEFLRMFQLVAELTRLGIVHGDLKPEQFLYRGNKIVLGDYGAAGFVSDGKETTAYLGSPSSCDKSGDELPVEDAAFARYFNLWQLARSFLDRDTVTLVQTSKKNTLQQVTSTELFPEGHPYHVPHSIATQFARDLACRPIRFNRLAQFPAYRKT